MFTVNIALYFMDTSSVSAAQEGFSTPRTWLDLLYLRHFLLCPACFLRPALHSPRVPTALWDRVLLAPSTPNLR